MSYSLSDSILTTVAYADIFDYPLRSSELWYWLIGRSDTHKTVISKLKQVTHDSAGDVWCYLPGRSALVRERIFRQEVSVQKLGIARRVARILGLIPGVQFVGVTGGVAMNNAKNDDDIDLCIITARRTLWSTRLITTLVTDLVAKRRKPHDQTFTDKICLNLFLTEDALGFRGSDRTLYIAHEILQMKPLWDRGGHYQQFLSQNAWVKKFLPNAWNQKFSTHRHPERISGYSLYMVLLGILEPIAKKFQTIYMRPKRTTEIISDTFLRFHPRDTSSWIYQELSQRVRKYKIPLDKVFFNRIK